MNTSNHNTSTGSTLPDGSNDHEQPNSPSGRAPSPDHNTMPTAIDPWWSQHLEKVKDGVREIRKAINPIRGTTNNRAHFPQKKETIGTDLDQCCALVNCNHELLVRLRQHARNHTMPESDLIQLKCWGSAHELVAIQVASVAASHAKANPGVPTDNLEIIVQTDLAQIFNDWSQGRSAIKLNQIIAQAEVSVQSFGQHEKIRFDTTAIRSHFKSSKERVELLGSFGLSGRKTRYWLALVELKLGAQECRIEKMEENLEKADKARAESKVTRSDSPGKPAGSSSTQALNHHVRTDASTDHSTSTHGTVSRQGWPENTFDLCAAVGDVDHSGRAKSSANFPN